MSGDTYKRRNVTPDSYQCGCYWIKTQRGDQLIQCQIHQAATDADVRKFDRERKQP